MSTRHSPAFYDSFNARNLAPAQVAATFVAPEYFSRLIGSHHSLILGPRGSGKTTLLKMLQQEALDAWNGPDSLSFKEAIQYNSVFIATDISWGMQVACLGGDVLDSNTQSLFATASFTTQILKRLVESFIYLSKTRHASIITPASEVTIARELSSTWKLPTSCVSLLAVKYELSRRLATIHETATQESQRDLQGRTERLVMQGFLHLSFLPCCASAVDVYNDAVGNPHGRWAFLFDELELAPQAVREYLLKSLRSVDERFLFKLSLVPVGREAMMFQDALSPSPGHDFEVIPLWYATKEESLRFCRRLWREMVEANGYADSTPEKCLGASVFDTDSSEWKDSGTAYGPDSRLAKRFAKLAAKDASFLSFLNSHKINVEELHDLKADKRASVIRKATSIVAIREAFIRTHEGTDDDVVLRTRKATDIYTGADAVFAITEGNPRWFKGIVGPMLQELPGTISVSVQNREIGKAVRRFRALLRTIPSEPPTGSHSPRGLLSILDDIGGYFHKAIVRDAFTLDPPGTVTIDSRVSDAMLDGLGKAINAGAIVSMEPQDTPWSSLRGKKVRLSYLLAAHYGTSLRVERSVALSNVLSRSSSRISPPLLFERGEPEDA